jgi:outer membrane usher protein
MRPSLKQSLCWINHSAAGWLICIVCFACGASIPVLALDESEGRTVQVAQGAPPKLKERLLQVDVDLQQLNETVLVLEDEAGSFYLRDHDLQRWRLHLPKADTAIGYLGDQYYPLTAISDVTPDYDPKTLTLMIKVKPEAFTDTTRAMRYSNIPGAVRPEPGGFLNYDLFIEQSPGVMQRAGQLELGFFNRSGVGTSTVLADASGASARLTRLDTAWTVDYPQKMQTLNLGDAITSPGSWGRSVRYGGIRFGSNFGTQPGLLTYTPQKAVGQAVLPSTVDVFVNNALVSRQRVPPGPFSISNLPIVNGSGQVLLVVRDVLGREQIISQPFYASQSLLRKGLENYSYELGRVRNNFGLNSNDYGGVIATATYRRGLNEHVTAELHTEAMRDQATVGVGSDILLPQIGTFNGYIAGSYRNKSQGSMVMLGLDRQADPWSAGMRTQINSPAFTQIGWQAAQLPPIHQSHLNLSYQAHRGGSVAAAYVWQHNRNQSDMRIMTFSYSLSLGKLGSFTLSALRNLTGDVSTTVFALFSIPLEASTSLSISSQSTAAAGNLITTTLQRNLPAGEGDGYRLQTRSDGVQKAGYLRQNNLAAYSAEIAQGMGATATRLNATGGIAVMGGNAFMSRRIEQSFAVVRIPDYPGIHVLADNQPAGVTNADGNALIPRLRAYDRNVISIDQRDLPLDAEIGTLKLEVVPFYRSGISVPFPIRRARAATLTLKLENGNYVPVGALINYNNHIVTVGYEGQAYITGLNPANHLRVTWHNQHCELDVAYSVTDDPLPDLGVFICKGEGM